MKKASVCVLVLMAVLATGCANKMIYTNPAKQAMDQNTAGPACSGLGTWWVPQVGCLQYADGYWRKPGGVPAFNSALQPLSDDVRAALDAVSAGGLAFYLGATTAQSWGLGAGVYFIEKVIQAARRHGKRGREVPGLPNFPPGYPGLAQEGVSASGSAAQVSAAVGAVVGPGYTSRVPYAPVSRPPQSAGEWGIRNRSGLRVEVWFCLDSSHCDQFIGRLNNREYMIIEAPRSGARYQAKLLVPNTDGGIDEVTAPVIPIEPSYDGWFVVAPPVASQKKGDR